MLESVWGLLCPSKDVLAIESAIEEEGSVVNKPGVCQNKSLEIVLLNGVDKKKYGALLPKTGVYFLPDERVVAFLK